MTRGGLWIAYFVWGMVILGILSGDDPFTWRNLGAALLGAPVLGILAGAFFMTPFRIFGLAGEAVRETSRKKPRNDHMP